MIGRCAERFIVVGITSIILASCCGVANGFGTGRHFLGRQGWRSTAGRRSGRGFASSNGPSTAAAETELTGGIVPIGIAIVAGTRVVAAAVAHGTRTASMTTESTQVRRTHGRFEGGSGGGRGRRGCTGSGRGSGR